MRAAGFALIGFAALVAASACGGDDRPPAALDDAAGRSGSGGKGGRASGGSPSEAGSTPRPEGGTDGVAGQDSRGGGGGAPGAAGGGIVYETAGAPAFIPGLCDPGMEPEDEAAQKLEPMLTGATLLTMTPDERTVVFLAGEGAELRLYVGDRDDADAAFEHHEVTLPAGYEAKSGATISSDARSLVLVRADHAGFGALSRAARGELFVGDADITPFSRINAQKAMSGRELGWPVLSSDGKTLYFLSYFGHGVVVQSTMGSDGRFDLGAEIDPYTLGGDAGSYKLINGVSADQRAIFFFDEATERSMALFRSRPGAPFYEPIDLGERRGASPNADCSRLYSSLGGEVVAQNLR